MDKTTEPRALTPRQTAYVRAYTSPESLSFGNAYQSAKAAGYTDQTARNITHLQPNWLSDFMGNMGIVISPDEIMQQLTGVIRSDTEPTIIKLKAMELSMKAYSMLVQRTEAAKTTVTVNVDLSGS